MYNNQNFKIFLMFIKLESQYSVIKLLTNFLIKKYILYNVKVKVRFSNKN